MFALQTGKVKGYWLGIMFLINKILCYIGNQLYRKCQNIKKIFVTNNVSLFKH